MAKDSGTTKRSKFPKFPFGTEPVPKAIREAVNNKPWPRGRRKRDPGEDTRFRVRSPFFSGDDPPPPPKRAA